MIERYLMKCLWDHLPSLIHLEKKFLSSNVEVFLMK